MMEFNDAICKVHEEDIKEIKADIKLINGTLRGKNGNIGICAKVEENSTYIKTQLAKQEKFQWVLITQTAVVIGALIVAVLKWFILG